MRTPGLHEIYRHEDTNLHVVAQDIDHGFIIGGHDYHVAKPDGTPLVMIKFQCGTIPEVGINGLTNECLMAILIDRLSVLDEKFPCDENKVALQNIQVALAAMEERTAKRRARGVEGKHVV